MGAVKDCLPENVRWDDDDILLLEEPVDHETLDDLAASISFEDWGADR